MNLFFLRLGQLIRFLRFYRKARTSHDIHSPFVSTFIAEVLEDDRQYYAFSTLPFLRKQLKKDKRKVQIVDYGAGSLANASTERLVSDIARHTPISDRIGQILFKTVKLYQPAVMLELGTSLGLSGMYQAAAHQDGQFLTIEGCPDIARIANENFEAIGLQNIQLFEGPFGQILDQLLPAVETVDYLFVDGDHRYAPTLDYFERCLPKVASDSVFVIADIHWSSEMERAWEKLKAHPEVRLSIDLFDIGLLFFNPAIKERQHTTLVPSKWKPWRLGLFQ